MKLIDKYLYRSFLTPLMYCLLAFIMVYIIYDLFSSLDNFVDARTPLLSVMKYYVILIPSALIYIVPISLMLSVLYSLSSLTKNSEITAMRACGISLFRLMVPFMVIGFIASATVAVFNETLGPDAAYWCKKFVSQQRKADPDSVHIHTLAFHKNSGNRFWYINEFDTRDFSMKKIEVIQMREEDNSERFKLTAEEGSWMDGYWIFSNITVQYYDNDGNPRGPPEFIPTREMNQISEQPVDFMSEIKPPDFMSSRELIRYLKVNKQLEKEAITRKTVDLHFRLAQPWTCFIATLIGIPFGSHTGRKGALLGFALSIGFFFSYYALINTGLYMGKEGYIPAWLAGWLPNILFFISGGVLVYRMR